MKRFPALTATLLVAAIAPMASADGLRKGSALVYPVQSTGLVVTSPDIQSSTLNTAIFTLISVTNGNTDPVDGATNVHYQYLNTVYNPQTPSMPLDCIIIDRTEVLTPADTLTVLVTCHNAGGGPGYLVVTAQDPSKFKTNWSFNHLLGSEILIFPGGGFVSLNAIPFQSPLAAGTDTDDNGNGLIDFDGTEYEEIPAQLYLDSSLGGIENLVLIPMTGGKEFTTQVKFHIFNDNERPLSATAMLRCWWIAPLPSWAFVFNNAFLANNTQNDPQEIDLNCDGLDDLESAWAIISGVVASSNQEAISSPALLGALAGPLYGRRLWESDETVDTGDFFNFGANHPDF